MNPSLLNRILTHYPNASAWDRFHLRQRIQRCPYDFLVSKLPLQGKILDIGCGYAHLAWYLAETGSNLEYFGSDIDSRKISVALQGKIHTISIRKQLLFDGDVTHWKDLPQTLNAIVMLDILYLIPWTNQVDLLEFAYQRIQNNPDAVILLKILPELHGLQKLQTWWQERLMVLLGKTKHSGAIAVSQQPERYCEWAKAKGMNATITPLQTSPASTLVEIRLIQQK